jgi:hypothetical protein
MQDIRLRIEALDLLLGYGMLVSLLLFRDPYVHGLCQALGTTSIYHTMFACSNLMSTAAAIFRKLVDGLANET